MSSLQAPVSKSVDPARVPASGSSAAVWINGRGAVVACLDTGGRMTTCTIERRNAAELAYLNLVTRAIGDRERVLILGPGSARLALEREYVTIYHRPDHLVDVEPAGPLDELELVDRVRQLAG